MNHLTDDNLRAYLDNELEAAARASAAEHLTQCAICRAQHAALETRAARVYTHLAALAPGKHEAPRPAHIALAQLHRKEKVTMLQSMFAKRLRPLWAGLTIIATLTVAFSFAPVRALAGQFLGLFRVQQVKVVPVDTTRLSDLGGNTTLSKQISQLFSDSITVTRPGGEPRVVANAAEAAQAAGFSPRLPDNQPAAPQLTVQDGTAFQFVVNRDRAQAILNEAGRPDLQLPASLDGATVQVDIPASLSAAYGNCPSIDEAEQNSSRGRSYSDCVIFVQIPSPTVTTPPDVDLTQVAEVGLEFSGMTQPEARAFSQNVDWTSTLVIPIPRYGSVYKQVPVDGVTGNLIQRPIDDMPEYALIWVKNGIIYAIGGYGIDSDKALAMANALK